MTDSNRWGDVVPASADEIPMGSVLAVPVYERGRRVGYFWARDANPITHVGIVPVRGNTPASLAQMMSEALAQADDGLDAHEIMDDWTERGRWFEVGPVEPATLPQLRSAIMDE